MCVSQLVLTYSEVAEAYFVLSKAKPTKASSLPHLHIGYRPQPSAFSRDPALTPVVNVRDSVSTHQSGTSSSLYPPSTATISRADSPLTPPLITHDFESIHQSAPMNPEIPEIREYNNDDVAYRLRLLVNNNYFLPPAHAKPSPADFAPALDPKKLIKSPSPTFFDRFRVGKSKSKPTTPTALDHPAPMLRTTSDSITSHHIPRGQQSKPSGQIPRVTINIPGGPPRGRVVVVREKVEDIMVAAKQAEQDLKAKSAARLDHESQNDNDAVDNAIDPTDAVDIPLPSPSYPFAVQASALHGLGVQDSVGADVLADRLPPNTVSYDPAEDRWRKALLQEAVHHSLDNTANSSFSNVVEVSTPKNSFGKKSLESGGSPLSVSKILQQKIIDQPTIDIIESTPLTEKRPKSANSRRSKMAPDSSLLTVNSASQVSRPGSFLPLRAETPSGPMTSLGPAPRRIFNTPASLSQTNLTAHEQQRSLPSVSDHDSHRVLRRSHSSPHLIEGYDSSVSRLDAISPPLPKTFRDSQATTISTGTVRASYYTIASPTEWERQDSFLEMAPPRPSFATSRSEYSQPSASPTLSTFQVMTSQSHESGVESLRTEPSRLDSDQQRAHRGSPSLRYAAMSPPPRMSSSLAHVALPPPPRTSSLTHQFRSQLPVFSDSSDSSRTEPVIDSLEMATLQIVAPEPTTPPLPEEIRPRHDRHPFGHRRSQSSRAAGPSGGAKPPISAQATPGPSSPTSFFDTLQSQPNAMDDLESSSDEDNGQPVITTPPKPLADFRHRAVSNAGPPRASIMRQGNFSTPYLRSRGSSSHLGHNVVFKKPIENVPFRPSKYDLPPTSYDFFKYAQDHPLTSNVSQSPIIVEDSKSPMKTEMSAQESLKKLDGMLMRHMEDERDTIKRIAYNLKQTARP